MFRRNIIVLSLVIVIFTGCRQDASFLPKEFDSLTLYSLESDFDKLLLPDDAELFHGYAVLGKTDVSKEVSEKVVASIRSDIANGSTVSKCFWPHHALRILVDGKPLDVLICYKCRGFKRTDDGVLVATSFPIDVSSRQMINEILQAKGIDLSPAATESPAG